MTAAAILVLAFVTAASGASLDTRLDTQPCGTHTMTVGERVIIQSPNFPSPYSVNYRCQWEFSCPPETETYLKFVCPSFSLQSSTDCINDRLTLTQRGSSKVLCGTNSPTGTSTPTGWTRLTFFSNANIVSTGFRCYITCMVNPTPPTTTTSTTPTPSTTTTTTSASPTTTTDTTTAVTTTPVTTTAATNTSPTTAEVTTTAATTTAATTTAAANTPLTTTADTTTAAITTPPTTTTDTTTAETTTLPTTTTPTTTTPTTTTPTTTTPTTTTPTTTTPTTTTPTTTTPTTTTPTTTTPTTTTPTTTTPTTTPVTTTASTTAATTTTITTTTGSSTTVGFDLKACGNYTMSPGQRVVIESTNFPKNYITNERCQWEFLCPIEANNYLNIICPAFNLESSSGCTADRLIVTSRGTTATKCGTDSPDGTVTSTGWARFTYSSNSAIVATGFRCYIWCQAR